jgi:transcriptional regulator with XRE-family HTH domain
MEIVEFLHELMRKRKKLASQLAADIGVSHATMHRWLTGKDVPSTRSCRMLAEYSGMPVQEILASAGHIVQLNSTPAVAWPEFREYAMEKYADELDEDVITMIEDLIERRRQRKVSEKKRSTRRK